MPQQIVFPCPSCGASVSADEGASQVQCQFCGNTAYVPGSSGKPAAQAYGAPLPSMAPQPGPVSAAPQSVAYHDRRGRPAMLNYAEFKVIADAVRAGDKAQAAMLFQQMFQVSPAEAQQDIETLAAGQEISVGAAAGGGNMWLGVAKVAPPAPITFSGDAAPVFGGAFNNAGPMGAPVIGGMFNNAGPIGVPVYSPSPILMSPPINTRSGLFRLNMIATGCALLVAVVFGCGLPIVMAIPGFFPGLAHIFSQFTSR